MKYRIFAAAAAVLALGAGAVFAQPAAQRHARVIATATPVKTPPLRAIPNLEWPAAVRRIVGDRKASREYLEQIRERLTGSGQLESSERTIPIKRKPFDLMQPPAVHDFTRQSTLQTAGPRVFTTPIANFDGIGQSSGDTIGCAPPDTNMAAGVNYVVEIVNQCDTGVGEYEVYDKTGAGVMGPIPLANLWSAGNCTDGSGDSVVLYDRLAGRWILSQFAGANGNITDECVAVSATGDPTGSYFVYDFSIDPNGFTDYPKLGVWPDAYYAAFNDFLSNGDLLVNFAAFQRTAMLAGNPAEVVVIDGPSVGAGGLDYSALPADLDGYTPPPAGAPGIFVNYISPGLFGSGAPYALLVWQMSVDWADPGASTLSGPTGIAVAPFVDGAYTNVPEPGGNQLDTLGDRLMFRLAYRNFGDHQALVVNHTVTANGNTIPPLGVRWYELDAPAGATSASAWSVAQQATYAPADGTSRWMASIAMDNAGDAALGFSTSSSNVNPGISYTGRLASDPAGTMTQSETVLKAGTGYQTGTGNRWGDYSSMVLDPTDDCTFWYAQEYYAVTGQYNWSTHIGAFKFDTCAAVQTGVLSGTVTDAANGNPVAGAEVLLPGGFEAVTDASGAYSITAAPGSYTARTAAYGYTDASASVAVTAGATTTHDFTLTLAPTFQLSGSLIDAGLAGGSKHGWGLYGEVAVLSPLLGEVAAAWTNPLDGSYGMTLPQGGDYGLTASAFFGGYETGTASLTSPSADMTRGFPLAVDASSCTALGYSASGGPCALVAGGLVVGEVTQANNGNGVAGAFVADDLGNAALTRLTPDDTALNDIYGLFTQSGLRTLSVSAGTAGIGSAQVTAADDQVARRDVVLGSADISVSLSAGSSLQVGDSGTVATVTVTNNGPDTAAAVQLQANVSSELSSPSGQAATGSCSASGSDVSCDLGDIAAGGSVAVTLKATGSDAGQASIAALVSESDTDPTISNNVDTAQVKVTAKPSSGGGGGSFGWLALAALLLLAAAGIRRVRRA